MVDRSKVLICDIIVSPFSNSITRGDNFCQYQSRLVLGKPSNRTTGGRFVLEKKGDYGTGGVGRRLKRGGLRGVGGRLIPQKRGPLRKIGGVPHKKEGGRDYPFLLPTNTREGGFRFVNNKKRTLWSPLRIISTYRFCEVQ